MKEDYLLYCYEMLICILKISYIHSIFYITCFQITDLYRVIQLIQLYYCS